MATKRTWPDIAIPPGEVLAEELEARGLTQSRLARLMHRPLQAINEIVRGRKRITGATALELADALGTSAELWIRLEADYELNKARLVRRHSMLAKKGWKLGTAATFLGLSRKESAGNRSSKQTTSRL
jgi:HTH-type transcriptional regulator/antitoxin HigA